MTCPDCQGSGESNCENCGDWPEDCCCDDPEFPECDTCDGTGIVEDDKFVQPASGITKQEKLEGLADRGYDTLDWEER